MRIVLPALGVVACSLLSCVRREAEWQPGGRDIFVVRCRQTEWCYWGAAQACPYGYTPIESRRETTGVGITQVGNATAVTVARRGEIVIKCAQPAFCDSQPCADGATCIASQRFPGRQVCTVR